MATNKYKITVKTFDKEKPEVFTHEGPQDKEHIKKFFELDTDPDIEWYEIEKIN